MVIVELEAWKSFKVMRFEILSPQGQKWKIIEPLPMCCAACDPSGPVGSATDVYKWEGGTRDGKMEWRAKKMAIIHTSGQSD